MKVWLMAAAVAMVGAGSLAGCAALQGGAPGSGVLLDQYVDADPYMIMNCVYYGWSALGGDVETTGYDLPNTNRVKVLRGQGPDGKPVYDPILDIVKSGFGAEIRYTEAHPGTLPAGYKKTVLRCMRPYAGYPE